MDPRDLVADVAQQYDNSEGDLERAALARLAWRSARSGRRCSKCGDTKPVSDFGRNVREKDALRRQCKTCDAADNARAYKRRVNG